MKNLNMINMEPWAIHSYACELSSKAILTEEERSFVDEMVKDYFQVGGCQDVGNGNRIVKLYKSRLN